MKLIMRDGDIYYLTGPTEMTYPENGLATLKQHYEFSGHPELLAEDGETCHKGIQLDSWGKTWGCDVPGAAQIGWFKKVEETLVPISHDEYFGRTATGMWERMWTRIRTNRRNSLGGIKI